MGKRYLVQVMTTDYSMRLIIMAVHMAISSSLARDYDTKKSSKH